MTPSCNEVDLASQTGEDLRAQQLAPNTPMALRVRNRSVTAGHVQSAPRPPQPPSGTAAPPPRSRRCIRPVSPGDVRHGVSELADLLGAAVTPNAPTWRSPASNARPSPPLYSGALEQPARDLAVPRSRDQGGHARGGDRRRCRRHRDRRCSSGPVPHPFSIPDACARTG